VIDTFFEEGLEGNIWADNVVDICPVGALVSKDFLHKARAWDLDRTPSICPNCTQGCNITLQVRDNEVMRLKPRPNEEVNGHWMCDYGRLNYGGSTGPAGSRRRWCATGDRLVPMSWSDALTGWPTRRAAHGRVRAVVSPFAPNEDLGALRRVMDALGGGEGCSGWSGRGGGAARLPAARAARGPRGERARGRAVRLRPRRRRRRARAGWRRRRRTPGVLLRARRRPGRRAGRLRRAAPRSSSTWGTC
jgi:hypothetical protein